MNNVIFFYKKYCKIKQKKNKKLKNKKMLSVENQKTDNNMLINKTDQKKLDDLIDLIKVQKNDYSSSLFLPTESQNNKKLKNHTNRRVNYKPQDKVPSISQKKNNFKNHKIMTKIRTESEPQQYKKRTRFTVSSYGKLGFKWKILKYTLLFQWKYGTTKSRIQLLKMGFDYTKNKTIQGLQKITSTFF